MASSTSTTTINGKEYYFGIDIGSGLGHTLTDADIERHKDVLVPPSPEQIDTHIADYESAKAAADKAKEGVDDAKKIIVFLADNFGHRAPGAEQSVRLAGTRNAALVTRGSTVVVDEGAVLELRENMKALPAIFARLFSAQTTHKLLKGAREVLLGMEVPRRRHEKLLALFGKCFDVKTNAPSLKVEVIKPKKPAKKPRQRKGGRVMAKPTPKSGVLHVFPTARLDYYESMRNNGKPCWFIRLGWQGEKLSDICASPRQAWSNASANAVVRFAGKAGA